MVISPIDYASGIIITNLYLCQIIITFIHTPYTHTHTNLQIITHFIDEEAEARRTLAFPG